MSEATWAAQVIDIAVTSKHHNALAAARWLLRFAAEGVNPIESLQRAAEMDRLAADIAENPDHYQSIPEGVSDWQWFHSKGAA